MFYSLPADLGVISNLPSFIIVVTLHKQKTGYKYSEENAHEKP